MEQRFTLIMEGMNASGMGSWGFRLRTKRPGGEIHTICTWLPSQQTGGHTVTEQLQVMEDAWITMLKQFVGIQDPLPF